MCMYIYVYICIISLIMSAFPSHPLQLNLPEHLANKAARTKLIMLWRFIHTWIDFYDVHFNQDKDDLVLVFFNDCSFLLQMHLCENGKYYKHKSNMPSSMRTIMIKHFSKPSDSNVVPYSSDKPTWQTHCILIPKKNDDSHPSNHHGIHHEPLLFQSKPSFLYIVLHMFI